MAGTRQLKDALATFNLDRHLLIVVCGLHVPQAQAIGYLVYAARGQTSTGTGRSVK
jgi:hypothetical protein